MTVTEYRKKYPNCEYCKHKLSGFIYTCSATGQKLSKRTAKKCPCYEAETWRYDKKEKSNELY